MTKLSLALVLASACSSSPNPPMQDPLAVLPAAAQVPTCRAQAFASNAADLGETVAWSVAGGGTIDAATGLYHAPIQVPDPATATVTATAGAQHATAAIALATAFPGPLLALGTAATEAATAPNAARLLAVSGARAYALVQTERAAFAVSLVRSDDGGATWSAPLPIATFDGPAALVGTALAIDAGDPDLVYATLRVDGGAPTTATIAGVGSDQAGSHLALLVSRDAGATWTEHALFGGGNGDVDEPDVVSPAPNTVVVTAALPWADSTSGEQGEGVLVWRDDRAGDGFATPTVGDNGYDAYWTPEVEELRNGASETIERNAHGHGPHLATNGAGVVCLTYAEQSLAHNEVAAHVQCSTNAGKAWGPDAVVATGGDDTELERPRLAISPDGKTLAVTFNAVAAPAKNLLVVSTDGGATWGTAHGLPALDDGMGGTAATVWSEPALSTYGELWVARQLLDTSQIAFDKSCDGGATWSGTIVLDDGKPFVEPMLVSTASGTFLAGVRYTTPGGDSHPMVVRLAD